MKNIRYIPKITTSIVYFILLIIVAILFAGRKIEFFNIDSLLHFRPDLYQHISNFSISYILFSGIGYIWLLIGVHFKYISGLGVIILASNFIYEMWIPILNVPDIIDAFYGFSGTLLAFVFLLLTKKYGIKPNMLAGIRHGVDLLK